MRILAIRGCNLASLAGEFEIDLARAPLGGAGVFAIVGNTGAGKSTLLDALCVALFDRTPRLTNHSRVQVGRGDDDPAALGAQDVRTLLRRGAAMGWAEVDFESGDARRYRARWSVRRARNQSDGTLQAQQISLTALDGGERLGGTKTETLDAIHDRLGLSFDQFRRSALLAQGEFAAFLRADGKDRSELLERMTGTEIYSRLSIAAHARAVAAEQRLRDGRQRVEAIAVLGDAARAEAEAAHEVAEAAKHAARARLAAAEAAERWRDEAERRATAVLAATSAATAAATAVEAAAPERAELAVRRRAEALRPAFVEAERLDRAHTLARAAADEARAAAVVARGSHAAAAARRDELAAVHAPVRAARVAALLVESTRSTRRAVDAMWMAEAKGPRNGPLASSALADAAWLQDRAGLAGDVAAWPAAEEQRAQQMALAEGLAELARARDAQAAVRAGLEAERTRIAGEHATAVKKLAEAQRRAQSFQQKRGITLDAARRDEDEARTRVADVDRLVGIAAKVRAASEVRTQLVAQRAELAAAAGVAEIERVELGAARDAARLLRGERTRVVDELRRAAGYAHPRAELVEGEECPLCGATEHPWHGRGALDAVIAAAEAALGEASSAHDTAVAALAKLVAHTEARTREDARLVAQLTAAEAAVAAGAVEWRGHLAQLGELMLEADPATPAAARIAAELAVAARERLETARTVASQAQAAAKAAGDAQAEMQLAQAMVDQHVAALADSQRRLAELEVTAARTNTEHAARAERHAELSTALAAVIARWQGLLATIDGRRGSIDVPEAARRAIAAPELGPAFAALGDLAAKWLATAERVVAAEAGAGLALRKLDDETREYERAAAECSARAVDAERRRDELGAELTTAAAALVVARTEAGFAAEELRALLAESGTRVEELARRLEGLERAAAQARAIAHERQRLVEEHEQQRGAHADALAANVALSELASQVQSTEQEAARLQSTLVADDDCRARRQAAVADVLALDAATSVDRVLGEVIGSHDGKLFRSFAQSLTLDGLLAVANAHLEELAPRYQLERVPKHDLELQVIDRDLGSEVRSVQSLSGGESFLVSLALALGLSSMSAQDVRVRTLLIDEGFGTLDPATLDGALAVLDRLQATGRQVGVISHVPALIERVGAHIRVVQRGGGRSEVVVG